MNQGIRTSHSPHERMTPASRELWEKPLLVIVSVVESSKASVDLEQWHPDPRRGIVLYGFGH